MSAIDLLGAHPVVLFEQVFDKVAGLLFDELLELLLPVLLLQPLVLLLVRVGVSRVWVAGYGHCACIVLVDFEPVHYYAQQVVLEVLS